MIRRRGMSLIELLVVMTASVIIVGFIGGMIQSLMRANRAAEGHLVGSAVVAQLTDVFRHDVHAAAAARSGQENEAVSLKLTLDGQHLVEYRLRDEEVIRKETDTGQLLRQNRFRLLRNGSARFEIQPDASLTRVSLVITRRSGKSEEGHSRELRVDATVGRDHRFVSRR